MNSTCHPIHQTEAQEMLQSVVRAICDRPGENAEQREVRARDVERSVRAFAPRDPVEIMLAGMAVGHCHLILDSLHSALSAPAGGVAGRTNSGIAGLDRAMIGLLKELRIAQTRPLEGAADAAGAAGEASSSGPAMTPPATRPKAIRETPQALKPGFVECWPLTAPAW